MAHNSYDIFLEVPWATPRASRHCPTEPCWGLPRTKSGVCPASSGGRPSQGSKPGCPLLFTTSAHFRLGHLRMKAGAHGRFSHQAFIIKKVPELPSPPSAQPPWAQGQSQRWPGVPQGSWASHGGSLLTGTEWVTFFRPLRRWGGSPPGLPVLWNSHFQCCVGSPWGPLPGSSAQAAAIHSWRVRSFLIYKSLKKKKVVLSLETLPARSRSPATALVQLSPLPALQPLSPCPRPPPLVRKPTEPVHGLWARPTPPAATRATTI